MAMLDCFVLGNKPTPEERGQKFCCRSELHLRHQLVLCQWPTITRSASILAVTKRCLKEMVLSVSYKPG